MVRETRGLPEAPPRPPRLRALAAAAALLLLSTLWVVRAEVIALVTQISESVPPIPALAALLLLALLNAASARTFGKPLWSRGEIALIYVFLSVAVACLGPAIGRFILSNLTAPFYYATPENHFKDLLDGMPPALAPQDPSVIKGLYEGSRSGVPWEAWIGPLGAWLLFLTLLWLTLLCLSLAVRARWDSAERLGFPLVQLPVQVLGGSRGSFFRNPILWVGFGISAGFDLYNILHALFPTVPGLGIQFPVGSALSAAPWDALRGLTLYIRPEMIGLGYLVSLEVSFSVWFFCLAELALRVVGRMMALDLPGYPFAQEQSIGAFLCLAALLLWGLRGSLRLRPAREVEDGIQPLWAAVGAAAGALAMVLWMAAAGLPAAVAVAFIGVLLAVALVYARIRAETGVPLIWMFPYGQQSDLLLNLFGGGFLLSGGVRGLAVFQSMAFLSRGYFPALMGTHLEALRLADHFGVSARRMLAVLALAAPIGLVVALVTLLVTYYREGAAAVGLWGTWDAVPRFGRMVSVLHSPEGPRLPQAVATGAGFAVAAALTALRRLLLGFPLHPLGFGMATAYGDLVWGPFLIVWTLKALILHYGGSRVYTLLLPGFIGLALGHFFVAGVVWGIVGAYVPEALPGYQVWFG